MASIWEIFSAFLLNFFTSGHQENSEVIANQGNSAQPNFFEKTPLVILSLVIDFMMHVDELRIVDEALETNKLSLRNWHMAVAMNGMSVRTNFFSRVEYDSRESLVWAANVRVLEVQSTPVKIVQSLRGKWRTELTWACEDGNKIVVEALLKRSDIDVNIVDQGGWIALTYAAFEGHVEVARLLITFGANVNGLDKHGRTPLHEACRNGHYDVVKLLLKKGAEKSRKNYTGWTPLHFAKFYGYPKIVDLLVKSGAKMDAAFEGSGEGWKALKKILHVSEN